MKVTEKGMEEGGNKNGLEGRRKNGDMVCKSLC